jgi:endonuclease/exonuclease/phosphatase family metal-dependent hydrolase
MLKVIPPFVACFLLSMLSSKLGAAEKYFTVATYNVENYVAVATGTRPAKSTESKAKVREMIRAMHPDILAIQEMGETNMLLELRASLRSEGEDFPHWEHVSGWDTNIHVAVLSRFPIVARRAHTNENFLLHGRRFHVSRGFAEVDIQVTPTYRFTLLTAHLKSRRPSPLADEAEMREQEAAALREIIDKRLNSSPNLNLVVLGDFNDVRDSRSTKTIQGTRALALIDTRPAERNGDNLPNPISKFAPRNVTWTHYYGKEDTYSRIDYILLSPGMAREWKTDGTYVLTLPNWGLASDHRPITASFVAEER